LCYKSHFNELLNRYFKRKFAPQKKITLKIDNIGYFRKSSKAHGAFGSTPKMVSWVFLISKIRGRIAPHMQFRGKEHLVWSLNNYLGLANHPEVRKADEQAAAQFGMAYPMGARMMSGNSKYHEQLEQELAEFVGKPDAFLLNYGYQGMVSIIDTLVDRNDVIVYDAESHACIIDGLRLHMGKRFVYQHNDIDSARKQLERATKLTKESGGGILLITEGVFRDEWCAR
jgi:glycine C-acetyltransferase